MIKIAIVDDKEEYLEIIKNIIQNYIRNKNINFRIQTFNKPKSLIYELDDKKSYDIFLLDIKMPLIDGLVLAKKIRQLFKKSYIIFITSHLVYAKDGYEVDAFRYILKNELSEKLPTALELILKQENRDEPNECYLIENSFRCEKIYFKDIFKIFKEEKNTIFVTATGEYKERNSLKNVLSRLPEKDFIRVDQGIVVNLENVIRVCCNEIFLKNGNSVFASRSNIRRIKEEISHYWLKKL